MVIFSQPRHDFWMVEHPFTSAFQPVVHIFIKPILLITVLASEIKPIERCKQKLVSPLYFTSLDVTNEEGSASLSLKDFEAVCFPINKISIPREVLQDAVKARAESLPRGVK